MSLVALEEDEDGDEDGENDVEVVNVEGGVEEHVAEEVKLVRGEVKLSVNLVLLEVGDGD